MAWRAPPRRAMPTGPTFVEISGLRGGFTSVAFKECSKTRKWTNILMAASLERPKMTERMELHQICGTSARREFPKLTLGSTKAYPEIRPSRCRSSVASDMKRRIAQLLRGGNAQVPSKRNMANMHGRIAQEDCDAAQCAVGPRCHASTLWCPPPAERWNR